MKISIDKKELLELLANQVKVNRKDLPILNCVLFHAEKDEGYLSVTSTDLDIQVKKHTQDVRVLEEGDAAIPLSELSKIAKKMGTCEIEIESYSKDGSYVKITAGGVTHVLEAFNADYFPCSITGEKLPDLKVTITSKVLCELIRRAKFAKAKDDTREVLLGCCMEVNGKRVTLAGTDGYVLAQTQGYCYKITEEMRVILSARLMSKILKAFPKDVPLSVLQTGSFIEIQGEGVNIQGRMIDGNFPKWTGFLKKTLNPQTTFVVDRKVLLSKLQQIQAEKDNYYEIVLSGCMLTMKTIAATAMLSGEQTGEDITATYCMRQTIDTLKAIDADEIILNFTVVNNTDVMTIMVNEEGIDCQYLIVPIIDRY